MSAGTAPDDIRLEVLDAVAEAIDAERLRIAGELHDDLGQLLTAIRTELHLLQLGPSAHRVEELVDSAIGTVRRITTGTAPAIVTGLGLHAALHAFVRPFMRRTGLSVELAIDRACAQLDERDAVHVYRIVREALTNVERHADARRVELVVAVVPHGDDGHVRVSEILVGDDGRGMPPSIESARHLGVRLMRHRARLLGGELTVTTNPHGGTDVRVVAT